MKGGYQIIDLTGLDLTVKDSQTSITDEKILKQLDSIKTYIQSDYDFSKPLNNQLKPILLRLRDKKNGEKQEASVWANLSVKTNNLTFVINGVVDSSNLQSIQIEVVFELKTDEYSNKYYGIKTAKYLLSGGVSGGTKLYLHYVEGTITNVNKTYNVIAYIVSNKKDAFEADDVNVFYNYCVCIRELQASINDEQYILVSNCANLSDQLWILDTDDTTFVMLDIADGFTTITSDTVTEL